jgi:UPF0755 protein
MTTGDATPEVDETAPPADAPTSAAPPPSRARRRRTRRQRLLRTVLVCGLVVLLLVAAVGVWYHVEANPTGPEGKDVVVTVAQGEATNTVLQELGDRGVIDSVLAFKLGDLFGGTPAIEPGTYLFHQHQAFAAVRGVLNGPPDVFTVTVEPGYSAAEVAERVDALPGRGQGGFEGALRSGAVHSRWAPTEANLEGMLGAGTYDVLPGESDTQLLARMVGRFDATAAAAGLSASSASALGLTPYQLITAASIVEKEGYYPVNMGRVARVIYNRLSTGTPLQMDSTVLYSLGQDGGPVTPQDLKLASPYNTYLHTGLTPTPISVPSRQALAAAVSPTPGTWRYFVVVDKNGTEAFAVTYPQQLANQAQAVRNGVG